MIKEFDFDSLEKSIPERSSNSHKGDFGKVIVVGGSEGMGGAAILSSEASLFSGAGLVHLRTCLLYTSPSPRDRTRSRMPSSA